MVKLSYVLTNANHLSEIAYSMSHRKNTPLVLLCPGDKSKEFYSMFNVNANYRNVHPVTLETYTSSSFQADSTVVILQPPQTFEALERIITTAESQKHSLLLCLLEENKKYLNIIAKKVSSL